MQSVLQQTTSSHVGLSNSQQPPEQCGEVSSTREHEHVCSACGLVMPASNGNEVQSQTTAATDTEAAGGAGGAETETVTATATTVDSTLKTDAATSDEVRPKPLLAAIKKQGVSAESSVQSKQQSYNETIPKYEKDYR